MSINHAILVRLAQAAYSTEYRSIGDEVRSISVDGPYRCQTCGRSQRVSAFARLHVIGDELVVAIRGTDDWHDVLADLSVGLCAGVHRGVRHYWEALEPHIIACLCEHPAMPVTLCGHSLGGADAELGAANLYAGGVTVSAVVTFGAPRFLARSVAAHEGREFPITRYVNGADPVPALPPLAMGYRHSTPSTHLGSGWLPSCLSAWLRLEGLARRYHPISRYVEALNVERLPLP